MRLAVRRQGQGGINQSTSQPQNTGQLLGTHSFARKSTFGGAEKMEVPREDPNLWILDKQPSPEIRRAWASIRKGLASVSGYTCVMNGEAGKGSPLLGNSGGL